MIWRDMLLLLGLLLLQPQEIWRLKLWRWQESQCGRSLGPWSVVKDLCGQDSRRWRSTSWSWPGRHTRETDSSRVPGSLEGPRLMQIRGKKTCTGSQGRRPGRGWWKSNGNKSKGRNPPNQEHTAQDTTEPAEQKGKTKKSVGWLGAIQRATQPPKIRG